MRSFYDKDDIVVCLFASFGGNSCPLFNRRATVFSAKLGRGKKEEQVNIYQILSVTLGLSLFLPLGWQILKGQVKQNLATFILWGSLDGIAAVSVYVQGGNYTLPSAYATGSILIIGCILKSRFFEWTWFETAMSALVCACIVGWAISGPRLATIMSSAGLFLASVPMMKKDAWENPKEFPTLIYCGYTTSNIFGIIGGKSWTVEERLYQFTAFVVCITMVLLSLRKYRKTAVSV